MSRSNMRGSVAGFVVVGAVLAALLLGSIYVVKTQLVGNVSDTLPEVAVDTSGEEQSADKSDDTEATNDTQDADKNKDKTESSSEDQQDQTDSEQSTSNDTAVDSSETEQSFDEQATSEDEDMPTTGVEVEELPTTGPTETLGMLAIFGILAGTIAYYRRSLGAKA